MPRRRQTRRPTWRISPRIASEATSEQHRHFSPSFSFSRDDVVVIVSVASQYLASLSLSLPRFQFFRFSKTSLLSLHASLQESARDPFLFFFLFFSRHTRVATVLPCQSWKFRGGGNERRVYRRAITGNKSGKIEWRDTIGYIAKKRRPINNRW